MKRHEALVPLSKEHHQALLLARLLRKDAPAYRGMPATAPEKIKYALAGYHSYILPHFGKEEGLFKLLKGLNEQMDELMDELTREHRELEICFDKMDSVSPDIGLMDKTGTALDNHIRKEERILFPMIQEICDNQTFDLIKSKL